MATFHFRLGTVQRLREAARDERRSQLAEAYRAEEIVRGRLAEVDQELAGLKQGYISAISPGSVNVDKLVDVQRYEVVLLAERKVIESQIDALKTEIEKRRDALMHADREVRVLEKLKETQIERFNAAEEKEEMKRLDEVAGRRFRGGHR